MGEYFELTFFLDKKSTAIEKGKEKILELLMLKEGNNLNKQHQYLLFSHKEVLFDVFEEDDFIEYRICLSDLIFTKRNFDEKLTQLLQVIDICFNHIESILFATGIYELTYYNIEGITLAKDFSKSVFSKFPLLFFRDGNEYGLNPTQRYGCISCVVNLGGDVQDIFVNQI